MSTCLRFAPERPIPLAGQAQSAAKARKVARTNYWTSVRPVSTLESALRWEMAALYFSTYDGSCESIFFADLESKDEVLLLYCEAELIGFSSLQIYRREYNGAPIRIVYSGDTVVARKHWGQQALALGWITRIGEIKRQDPELPLYWLLLVKGHRTFKYLAVFAKSFWPHWQVDRSDLKGLADALALAKFACDYNTKTGVIEFPTSRGHLKSELARPAAHELSKEAVRYFLEKNPGFEQGHELVCLCELEEFNLKPLTLRIFKRPDGYQSVSQPPL